ncbi:MAG: NAD-dependent epimerase/dehydratase family protein, partial [Thermoleophilia bacterium]|nr:NAD-dependent epimerase/dehydratase family protein [Thermoleophilia bacterium]
VDEAWATTGIPGNLYSAQKAQTERMLDAFEAAHPERRVVRMRPALIFNGGAGAHLARVFLGPLVPRRLAAPGALPVLPMPRGLVTQLVHVDDAADAFRRAVLDPDARGAYNVATEPELTAERIAEALETRVVTVPAPLVERAVELAWRARLQPLPGSWIRLAHRSPLLDSTRAREELGWSPRVDVVSAVRDTADGVADSSGVETGPLTPRGRAHGPMPGD